VRKQTARRLRNSPAKLSVKRANWDYSLQHPTEYYFECWRYFQQSLRPELREHRSYFLKNKSGFGEDAFHVMWEMLVQEFKPANFLEIGVFRGQVISLVSLCSQLNGTKCEVFGISQFCGAGDSVCKYDQHLDYYADTLKNFESFRLPVPTLVRASSTDPDAIKAISSRTWDMIYIDGNHDYEYARKDWDNCAKALKRGGIVVLDDANLTPAYQPGDALTRGMVGPTQVAAEADPAIFREILQVGHNRVFQKIRE
jgi:hypothetical protein